MLSKEKVLQTTIEMPNEFSIDDLVEKLIILEKIQIGIQQVREGKAVTMEEAKQRCQQWLR